MSTTADKDAKSEQVEEDKISRIRYIPNKLRNPSVFFEGELPGIGLVETPDAVVILGPGSIGLYLVMTFQEQLSLVMSGILMAISLMPGYFVLIFKPEYKNSNEWAKDFYSYIKRRKKHTLELDLSNNRKKLNGKVLSSDTRNWTKVERFYPDLGLVELTSGSYISLVEVSSENLDLASAREVNSRIKKFANFLANNNQNIQFYSTLEGVNLERKILTYKRRLRESDNLTEEMEEYVKRRAKYIKENRGTVLSQRKTYLIIKSDEIDYYEEDLDIPDRIRELPNSLDVVKDTYVKAKWKYKQITTDIPISEEEKRDEQINNIIKQTKRLERKMSNATGGDAKRIQGSKIASIIRSFWEGIEVEDDSDNIRQNPIMAHEEIDEDISVNNKKKRKRKKQKSKKKRK